MKEPKYDLKNNPEYQRLMEQVKPKTTIIFWLVFVILLIAAIICFFILFKMYPQLWPPHF